MHARIQIYWCRSSIFRHLKLELLTQFPASNDEKYINVVYIWRKFVSFYGYVHWRMTTEISVMYGSEKVKDYTGISLVIGIVHPLNVLWYWNLAFSDMQDWPADKDQCLLAIAIWDVSTMRWSIDDLICLPFTVASRADQINWKSNNPTYFDLSNFQFQCSSRDRETKMFLPHARVKVSIVGSLRDREVTGSALDRQGSNFKSCVWRTVSSQSSPSSGGSPGPV